MRLAARPVQSIADSATAMNLFRRRRRWVAAMNKHRLTAHTATLALIATLAIPATAQQLTPVPAPAEPVAAPVPASPAPQAPVTIQQAPAPVERVAVPVSPSSDARENAGTPRNVIAPEALRSVEAERQAARVSPRPVRDASNQDATLREAAASEPAVPVPEVPAASAVTSSQPVAAADGAPSVDDATLPAETAAEEQSDIAMPVIVGVAGIGIAFALLAWFVARRRRPSAPRPALERTDGQTRTGPQPASPMNLSPEPARPASSPVMTAGQAGVAASMTPISADAGRHERAALIGPTADNPFLTRRARLKRARFLDAREREMLLNRKAAADASPINRVEPAQPTVGQQTVSRPAKPVTLQWPGGFKPSFQG